MGGVTAGDRATRGQHPPGLPCALAVNTGPFGRDILRLRISSLGAPFPL
jgi:hypothetical protein